jgi:hypothetical protein
LAPVLLIRSEIDDQRWNSLITDSIQQIIYAETWYLDLVCESWKALVWPDTGDYQIVMPLPVREKWNFTILYQPFFCQYLGMFSRKEITGDKAVAFLQSCFSHFSYISAYHFHPLNFDALHPGIFKGPGVKTAIKQTVWLPLYPPYEVISKNYSSDRKLNLKRGRSHNWRIEKGTNLAPLVGLFKRNHADKIQGGVNQRTYSLLVTLFDKLLEKDRAELYYASQDGEIHAGALIARKNRSAIYLFNAADEIGRQGNARTCILDCFIKENAGKQVVFDFESPEKESVFSFYRSFGGNVKPYLAMNRNKLPFPVAWVQELRKFWFRTMRYLS